jgi:hypothetical protein
MFFSFTAGVIIGGAFWGNCNWGGSDIDINVNRYNEFNRNNVGNSVGSDGKFKHDPSHRKGAQYRDSATQERFGKGQNSNGVQSREQFRGRADQGRRDIAAGGATQDLAGNRLGGATSGNRLGGQGGATAGNLGGTRPSTQPGAGGGLGGQGGAAAARPSQPSSFGTANRSSSASSRGSEAFRSSGSGSYTRSTSQRGYSSRSSGGFSGGGMRGGGGRGGRR